MKYHLFLITSLLCCCSPFSSKIQAQMEVGSNDFRISDMGSNGNTALDATDCSITYNSIDNEYLVVWSGDNFTDNEFEIYGQRLAVDGSEIGTNDFRISDMGPDGSSSFSAQKPVVVYNSTDNEYLVVWFGDDDIAPLVDNETEIFGQRLAADGSEIGTNDFRISDMGPNGSISFGILNGQISAVYNSTNNQYLVVWSADDNTAPLVDNEIEVFGQILAADGSEVGSNDFRISDMGSNGSLGFLATSPSVTFNPVFNNYLVVWAGDDDTAPFVNNEFEIFGQRLSSAGAEIGTNDFRISDMGTDGNPDFDAGSPAVTYNTSSNEYFVVWSGDDNTAPLVEGEQEIFGQRLSVVGGEVGSNDFRISDMGPDGATFAFANTPEVAFNATNNEYLVVWRGDDASANQQVHVQILTAGGVEAGSNDFLISDTNWEAGLFPVAAHNTNSNEYLVTWSKTSNVPPFSSGEYEIFGQRISAASALPVELIDFSAIKETTSIQLFWKTASEINNDYFQIEKSANGKDFFALGKINSKGDANLEQQYSFIDKTLTIGANFYRLKQVDLDGSFTYSNIIRISVSNKDNFSVFPNPFLDEVTIKTESLYFPIEIKIHNALGQLAEHFYLENEQATHSFAHLPKGYYQISFWQSKELIFLEKLMKIGGK